MGQSPLKVDLHMLESFFNLLFFEIKKTYIYTSFIIFYTKNSLHFMHIIYF